MLFSEFNANHCVLVFRPEELFDPVANTNPIASTTHEVDLIGELC